MTYRSLRRDIPAFMGLIVGLVIMFAAAGVVYDYLNDQIRKTQQEETCVVTNRGAYVCGDKVSSW